MSPAPVFSNPLFNFALFGVGIGLVLLFLAAGVVFFFLSFTKRFGRSRWPLHALLALGIVSIGSGLASAGIAASKLLGTLLLSGGGDPALVSMGVLEILLGTFWFGFTGVILGLFAGIRAVLGLVREPGPKF